MPCRDNNRVCMQHKLHNIRITIAALYFKNNSTLTKTQEKNYITTDSLHFYKIPIFISRFYLFLLRNVIHVSLQGRKQKKYTLLKKENVLTQYWRQRSTFHWSYITFYSTQQQVHFEFLKDFIHILFQNLIYF